jgi:hypothetical protein
MAKVNIGLKQARRMCSMTRVERLDFIAEGLPIILESARGFWAAARSLSNNPREAGVLTGFANEEAAKILILMDAVRCPSNSIDQKIGSIIEGFYGHLARLIYAEAQSWKPGNVATLREYVNESRKSHELDGYAGELISPNSILWRRESQLYVDVAVYEDDSPQWSSPMVHPVFFQEFEPQALEVCESLFRLGIFSRRGLEITSEAWGQVEFIETEGYLEGEARTKSMLDAALEENLQSEATSQNDINLIYNSWQIPMYNIEFKSVSIEFSELDDERKSALQSEY